MSQTIIQPYRFVPSGDPTLWQELGRTTLGSAGDTITVSGLTAKDNLLLLGDLVMDGAGYGTAELTFNSDTGTNYSSRMSVQGNTDTTHTGQTYIDIGKVLALESFFIGFVRNVATETKLMMGFVNEEGAVGSGTAPDRCDETGFWSNNTNAISEISITCGADFASGSELVILGNNPTDVGTPFFELLGEDTLTGEGDILDSGTITAKKYLWVEAHPLSDSGATANNPDYNMTFNGSTSSYATRSSQNGGADGTGTNTAFINGWIQYQDRLVQSFVLNNATQTKLGIGWSDVIGNSGFGAGTAPNRDVWYGKHEQTSNSITTVTLTNSAARPSAYGVGSTLRCWGGN